MHKYLLPNKDDPRLKIILHIKCRVSFSRPFRWKE